MIHIIRTPATKQELADMLETLETYIKLAVDIDRSILAGGGALHAEDNLSMTIESLDIRAQVERITRQLLVSG